MTETNLLPHIIANLEAINKAARNHPELFQRARLVMLRPDGVPEIVWSKHAATQDEMIALVKLYPDAGWKRHPSPLKGDFDFKATIDGVMMELQSAESLTLKYETSTLDVSKLKLSTKKGKQ